MHKENLPRGDSVSRKVKGQGLRITFIQGGKPLILLSKHFVRFPPAMRSFLNFM